MRTASSIALRASCGGTSRPCGAHWRVLRYARPDGRAHFVVAITPRARTFPCPGGAACRRAASGIFGNRRRGLGVRFAQPVQRGAERSWNARRFNLRDSVRRRTCAPQHANDEDDESGTAPVRPERRRAIRPRAPTGACAAKLLTSLSPVFFSLGRRALALCVDVTEPIKRHGGMPRKMTNSYLPYVFSYIWIWKTFRANVPISAPKATSEGPDGPPRMVEARTLSP